MAYGPVFWQVFHPVIIYKTPSSAAACQVKRRLKRASEKGEARLVDIALPLQAWIVLDFTS